MANDNIMTPDVNDSSESIITTPKCKYIYYEYESVCRFVVIINSIHNDIFVEFDVCVCEFCLLSFIMNVASVFHSFFIVLDLSGCTLQNFEMENH